VRRERKISCALSGAQKFLFATEHADKTMNMVTELLADERRVSSAAMAALTGILSASPVKIVAKKSRSMR
jgi:hypothetical protein